MNQGNGGTDMESQAWVERHGSKDKEKQNPRYGATTSQ